MRETAFGQSYYENIWDTVHRHEYAKQTASDLLRRYGPTVRVLDIGCGCGALVAELRAQNIEAFGIDISDYALANTCSSYVKSGSVLSIPFPSRSFDLCFSQGLLEYVTQEDLPIAFNELQRVGLRQYHQVDFQGDAHQDGFATARSFDWWRERFDMASIVNDAWSKSTALIAAPIYDGKAYSIERWIDAARSLDIPDKEIVLVDNSATSTFYECWKSQVPMIHLDLTNEQPNRRIALSMEYIRQRFLSGQYSWWFNLEADVIVPTDAMRRMVAGHEQADWICHYYPQRGGSEPMNGFGCSLFSKRIMKGNGFDDAPADMTTDGWWWHSKIKGRPYQVVELYGLLDIQHLN